MLGEIGNTYGRLTEAGPIKYSTMGEVDITGYAGSYYSFVRGDRVITTNDAAKSYAPRTPLANGTAELGLRTSPSYFNNASTEGTHNITVEKEEGGAITVTVSGDIGPDGLGEK